MNSVTHTLGALVSGSVSVAVGTVRMVTMVFRRAAGLVKVYMPRTRFDYKREVDPAQNSIVVSTVGWMTRNFPDAPVSVTRTDAAGVVEVIRPSGAGAGAFLRLMKQPNPWQDGPLLWIPTLIDYLDGDSYWFKVRAPSAFPGVPGRVIGYWWLPKAAVVALADPEDPSVFIGAFQYTTSEGRYLIHPEDVIHFQNGINPTDQRRGVSVWDSLYRELFTDDQGANMTASLMRNLGVPGVTIAPANTVGAKIKDPEDIKSKFMEKFGGDHTGEPMVFNSAMDVKVISWSPQQMNLRDLRRVPEERVSAVLGVPAGVAGLGAGLDRNTFSNYGEARQAGYTEGIIPLHGRMAAALRVQALPDFVDTTSATVEWDVLFDWTKARAMQESVDAIWRRATDATTKGLLTRAQWKRVTNQTPAPDGSDEVYVMPGNYVTIPVQPGRPSSSGLLLPGTSPATPALPPGAQNGHKLIGATSP